MLTKRIIPCLDVNQGRVVKGTQFVDIRDAGDPVELAKRYEQQGADELVLLDISASIEGRGTFLGIVEQVARNVFIPFTVGGGVRTIEDIRCLLLAGADKVAINSAALETPSLLQDASAVFGAQALVVAMDVKKEGVSWCVYSHGGRRPTGRDAIEWALTAQNFGAGELLLTSIDRDGTKSGYDLELLQRITSQLRIPVIASGGVGDLAHIRDAFQIGGADAALMASIVHNGTYTIPQIKERLSSSGILVRTS